MMSCKNFDHPSFLVQIFIEMLPLLLSFRFIIILAKMVMTKKNAAKTLSVIQADVCYQSLSNDIIFKVA